MSVHEPVPELDAEQDVHRVVEVGGEVDDGRIEHHQPGLHRAQ